MIYVVIASTRGSAPRDAGTAMAVTAGATRGTIGGGALEYRAIARARTLLAEGREAEETVALGPGIGQCCGGSVRLRYTFEPQTTDADHTDAPPALPAAFAKGRVWLWGAGHVGRAFVRLGAPQGVRFTWVDEDPARFPSDIPPEATALPAADMPLLAARAEQEADHFIFTYSHDTDLALCDALLRRNVRFIGLIGSDTKWARFRKRLGEMGHAKDEIARITCPIGDKALGKAPEAIALGALSGLGTR